MARSLRVSFVNRGRRRGALDWCLPGWIRSDGADGWDAETSSHNHGSIDRKWPTKMRRTEARLELIWINDMNEYDGELWWSGGRFVGIVIAVEVENGCDFTVRCDDQRRWRRWWRWWRRWRRWWRWRCKRTLSTRNGSEWKCHRLYGLRAAIQLALVTKWILQMNIYELFVEALRRAFNWWPFGVSPSPRRCQWRRSPTREKRKRK